MSLPRIDVPVTAIVCYLVLFLFKLLQVFESNADYLSDELFLEYSFDYLKQIGQRVRQRLREADVAAVPMVTFFFTFSSSPLRDGETRLCEQMSVD